MAKWFSFAGQMSTNLGVVVQEYPPLTLPEERADFKPALGKSGSYTILEGDAVYEDIVLAVKCIASESAQLDQIGAWLRGSGLLVLGNMPDRAYIARGVNQIELERVLRGRLSRTFAATFRCKPYRYVYPQPTDVTLTSAGSVTNPGTADAEPVIIVTGSGNIVLTLGAKTIEITGLPAGSITIDTAAGVAYKTGSDPLIPLTGIISRDDWPYTIPPGACPISWTGSVSSVKISRPWRYI